ncbi:hypothetical protein ACQUZK_09755, partial [Streptococcus pyogenes]|uniref:hypothetical protein n=1 Tax=Streptococcus pyogenes TaxID=1314 RepID=UPI003DA1B908
LAYRLSPLLPGGGTAFTAHVGLDLSPRGGPDGAGAGTELRATFRVSDSTVGSADYVAGIEIGFGQSLDTLVATLAPAPQPTETETDTETDTDT